MHLPGWIKRRQNEALSDKFHQHAARLSDAELRTWGTTLGQHAAQRCELAALNPADDVGEIRDSANALQAVADELEQRASRRS